jgi:hypothetical protein
MTILNVRKLSKHGADISTIARLCQCAKHIATGHVQSDGRLKSHHVTAMPTCVGRGIQATQVAFAMGCSGFNRQSSDFVSM